MNAPLPCLVVVLTAIGWQVHASTPAEPSIANDLAPIATKAKPDTATVLRLNFRGVPLEQVLDYFGEATGFIIAPEVDVRGRVDVWSTDPLTRDEAVTVLNSALARNGFAALLTGRTLTIVGLDEAKRRNIPVRRGDNPENIPPSDDLVTQIIPVKFISAQQLLANLTALLPTASGLTANEGANALMLTDTQASVRRVAQIVKALDTPIAAFTAVRVFAIRFADAKTLATVLKDLFAPSGSGRSGAGGNAVQQSFTGGPGAFGANEFGGGSRSGTSGGSSASGGRVATPRVIAAVDELSNSLIVTAPEEQMPLIADVVSQLDVATEDTTELRVFKLQHAQPDELAATLKSLFPDPASGGSAAGSGPQFADGSSGSFGGGGPPTSSGSPAPITSERRLKQSRVNTVADTRTSSLLVSTSPGLMAQITDVITKLDADPARKQKVFIFPVQNSDPAQLQAILQGLFPSLNSNSSARTSSPANGTTTRATTTGGAQNQTGRPTSQATGSSGPIAPGGPGL